MCHVTVFYGIVLLVTLWHGQSRMAGLLVRDELERIWKEAVVA
jgi:hypothetical protein